MKNFLYKTKGSIALMSVLIISSLVLIFAISMSESNINTSYQYLNNQSQDIAYYGAEACFEEAMIRLKRDPAFNSGTLTVDSDTSCDISVNSSTLSITVNYLNYIEYFQADFSLNQLGQANNIQLLNWKEI